LYRGGGGTDLPSSSLSLNLWIHPQKAVTNLGIDNLAPPSYEAHWPTKLASLSSSWEQKPHIKNSSDSNTWEAQDDTRWLPNAWHFEHQCHNNNNKKIALGGLTRSLNGGKSNTYKGGPPCDWRLRRWSKLGKPPHSQPLATSCLHLLQFFHPPWLQNKPNKIQVPLSYLGTLKKPKFNSSLPPSLGEVKKRPLPHQRHNKSVSHTHPPHPPTLPYKGVSFGRNLGAICQLQSTTPTTSTKATATTTTTTTTSTKEDGSRVLG
jgi:hypothetical protein